jgi:hypothetical protein
MFRRAGWLRFTVVLLALVAIAPPQATARIRFGGIVVSGQYVRGPFIYPPFSPYYGYSYGLWWPYDPFWTAPYIGYPSPLVPRAETGKVILQNAEKDAKVYINGAYAGIAGDLRSLHLQPGVYELEVRAPQSKFQERIYVLSGKTMKLDVRSGKP